MTQRIASEGVFQAQAGSNIASLNLLDLLTMIGMHLKQSPDPFPTLISGVIHLSPGLHLPRINPEIDQPADKGVGYYLKGQGGERSAITREALKLFTIPGIDAHHRRYIDR